MLPSESSSDCITANLALEALRADLAEERRARVAAEARAALAEARAAAAGLLLRQIGAAATQGTWRAGTAAGEEAAAVEAKQSDRKMIGVQSL